MRILTLLLIIGLCEALPFHPVGGLRNTIDATPGKRGELSYFTKASAVAGKISATDDLFLAADLVSGITYYLNNNLCFALGIPVRYDRNEHVRQKGIGNIEVGFKYARSIGSLGYLALYPSLYLSLGKVVDSIRVQSTGTQDIGCELLWSLKKGNLEFSTNVGGYNLFLHSGKSAAPDICHMSMSAKLDLGSFTPFAELSYDWFLFEDLIYKVDKRIYGGSPLRVNLGATFNVNDMKVLAGFGVFLSEREVNGALPESLHVIPRGNMKLELFAGIEQTIGSKILKKKKKQKATGQLLGYIVDAETGELLPGQVWIGGKKLINCPEGYFELTDLPAGGLAIRVKAEGYADTTYVVYISKGSKLTYDFKLRREVGKAYVQGKVTSAKTGKPLAARVLLVDQTDYMTATDLEGNYFLEIPQGKHRIRAESEGYLPVEQDIELQRAETLNLNFKLYKPSEVTLPMIYFDAKSYEVKEEFMPHLKEIAEFLRKYPEVSLEVCGHTSSREGVGEYLDLLSRMRAEAVRDILVFKFGIDPGRLSVKAYGALRPIAPNSTPQGRRLNQRVDFRIVTH